MSPGSTPGLTGIDSSAALQARFLGEQQLLRFDTGISLVQAASTVTQQAIRESQILATAFKKYSRDSHAFPGEQQAGITVEAGGAGDRGAERAGDWAADLLFLGRWIRYAQRSDAR